MDSTPPADAYTRLLALLDREGARYRVLEHAPEGRTELVSALRGNPLAAAAKCIVLMMKRGKKVTDYLLAVIPGDARLDLEAVKALHGATYLTFAATPVAEELAGSVAGTILPFAFDPRLQLLADPGLRAHPELFFNAGRLDRSLALATEDWVRLAKPRFAPIALRETEPDLAAHGHAGYAQHAE